MVLERQQPRAQARQAPGHLRIARQRLWLVVMVAEHGLHAELSGQPRDLVHRAAVAHDERAAMPAQVLVQHLQSAEDELDAPVGARQWVQDVAVQHKGAEHLVGVGQRAAQGSLVIDAQVAAEPDEGAFKAVGGGLHAHRIKCRPCPPIGSS